MVDDKCGTHQMMKRKALELRITKMQVCSKPVSGWTTHKKGYVIDSRRENTHSSGIYNV